MWITFMHKWKADTTGGIFATIQLKTFCFTSLLGKIENIQKVYKAIIVSLPAYGCEIRFLALKEKQRLRILITGREKK